MIRWIDATLPVKEVQAINSWIEMILWSDEVPFLMNPALADEKLSSVQQMDFDMNDVSIALAHNALQRKGIYFPAPFQQPNSEVHLLLKLHLFKPHDVSSKPFGVPNQPQY